MNPDSGRDAASLLSGLDLERRSSAEVVADDLRELIFSGELGPGAMLREPALSQRLNVSRQTVREALNRLERDGLVEHLPYRGSTVRTLSEADARDLFKLRSLLEMQAVDAAIEGDQPHRDRLVKTADEFVDAVGHGSERALIDADLAFHRALIGALESPRIGAVYESLLGELTLVFAMTDRERYSIVDVAETHRTIAGAISRGDRRAARRLLALHLQRSLEDALARIARAGDN